MGSRRAYGSHLLPLASDLDQLGAGGVCASPTSSSIPARTAHPLQPAADRPGRCSIIVTGRPERVCRTFVHATGECYADKALLLRRSPSSGRENILQPADCFEIIFEAIHGRHAVAIALPAA